MPSPTPHADSLPTLRQAALAALLTCEPALKAQQAHALMQHAGPVGEADTLTQPPGIPGRPPQPQLVAPSQLKPRPMHTRQGRAALIHALAHIEFNAINLALDAVWRFDSMPEAFYVQWVRVAHEEALHFELLHAHLQTMGCAYGDLPAHNGLWEMAEKTQGDVLARLALVPRTLEARGLDASPAIRDKLLHAGDARGAEIVERILRDEIGHVAIGNHWYRWLCSQRGLDPITTYSELALRHRAPRLRGPFNWQARRAAGFEEGELAALAESERPTFS